jgi:hypothetical protein
MMRNYEAYTPEELQDEMNSHPFFRNEWNGFLEAKPYDPVEVYKIYLAVEDTLAAVDKPCPAIRPTSHLEKDLKMNLDDRLILHGTLPEPVFDEEGFMAVETAGELVDFVL